MKGNLLTPKKRAIINKDEIKKKKLELENRWTSEFAGVFEGEREEERVRRSLDCSWRDLRANSPLELGDPAFRVPSRLRRYQIHSAQGIRTGIIDSKGNLCCDEKNINKEIQVECISKSKMVYPIIQSKTWDLYYSFLFLFCFFILLDFIL